MNAPDKKRFGCTSLGGGAEEAKGGAAKEDLGMGGCWGVISVGICVGSFFGFGFGWKTRSPWSTKMSSVRLCRLPPSQICWDKDLDFKFMRRMSRCRRRRVQASRERQEAGQ